MLIVKFFDNYLFPYYNVQAFHKPSSFATHLYRLYRNSGATVVKGVAAVGLASLCARALLHRQDGFYFAKVFF